MDRFCLSISCRVHFFTPEALGPTTDLLPTYQGFIAHLVEHHTGIAEVMGSNPAVAFIFLFRLKNATALIAFTLRESFHSFQLILLLNQLTPLSGHRFATLRYLSIRKQIEIQTVQTTEIIFQKNTFL